jgi:hypothetical protein
MKKNSRATKKRQQEETIGIDLGDKVSRSRYAVVNEARQALEAPDRLVGPPAGNTIS